MLQHHSVALADSRKMASMISSPMSRTALLVLAAALVPTALGHDHGTDHIEEGETVSKDPIVRLRRITPSVKRAG